jgi:hypothetical protein
MKNIFTISIILFAFSVKSQENYVVTLKNDTIAYERINMNAKGITGIGSNKSKTTYTPLEVKAVKIFDKTHVPVIIDNKKSGAPSFFKNETVHMGELMAEKGKYKFVVLFLGTTGLNVTYDLARFFVIDETAVTVKWICTPFLGGCPLEKFNIFKQYFDVDCPEYKNAYKVQHDA